MAATACSDDCNSLSSSLSEEKDVAHFKEAAVVDCQHSVNLKNHKSKVSNDEDTKGKDNTMIRQSTKQLARQSLHEDNEEENEFETTKFRLVVAKRLTEILDQCMELTSRKPLHVHVKDDTNEEGVKLFSSSTCLISNCDQPYTVPVRKKRQYSTSSNSSEEERLAESVVTQETIFRESRACDLKLDILSNGLLDKPEQNNDNEVIADGKSKKKVKKKKKKYK